MKKQNPTLNDVFQPILGGAIDTRKGIFKSIQELNAFEFITLTNYKLLDDEYLYNHSGYKIVSPLVYRFVKGVNNYKISDNNVDYLASLIVNKYQDNWNRAWDVIKKEYNPIDNYSMTESEQIASNTNSNREYSSEGHENINSGNDITTSDTGTQTVDNDNASSVVNKGKVDTNLSASSKDKYHSEDGSIGATNSNNNYESKTDNGIFGFNSESSVDESNSKTLQENDSSTSSKNNATSERTDEKQDTSSTLQDTEADQSSFSNGQSLRTDDLHRSEKSSSTSSSDNDTNTQEDYNSAISSDRKHTRSGNIGVMTSQQMVESELDLRFRWNFLEKIFTDVDRVLALGIYGENTRSDLVEDDDEDYYY